MKNSNDTIGNQTRDLLTCSAVPQPTALPLTPKLFKYYPNFINICKDSPQQQLHRSRLRGMTCYLGKVYFSHNKKELCPTFLNPLCVCSKSNSIIFCLSLFDPVSLSLSTALHTYFPHPSSSLSQAFIHIFPTSVSLSLSWTSHIALIYRFWKWQPDILDDIVCHNKLCLNTYNYSYYFGFNSGC